MIAVYDMNGSKAPRDWQLIPLFGSLLVNSTDTTRGISGYFIKTDPCLSIGVIVGNCPNTDI
jgi:hypothetical protein